LILDLDYNGLGLRSIAKRFNTSKSTVERIKKNLNGFLVVDSNHKEMKIKGKRLEYNCGTLEMPEHTIAKFNELRSNGIPVTGKMFKSIAKNRKNEFEASKGGLTRFKLKIV
jgi:hypothetical protein